MFCFILNLVLCLWWGFQCGGSSCARAHCARWIMITISVKNSQWVINMYSIAIIRCVPWWRHLVSDCKVKSRTLAPSVWQPTALNLLFLSCVTGVWVCTIHNYDHCLLVERSVLTAIRTIIIIIIIILLYSQQATPPIYSWKFSRSL